MTLLGRVRWVGTVRMERSKRATNFLADSVATNSLTTGKIVMIDDSGEGHSGFSGSYLEEILKIREWITPSTHLFMET